MELQGNIDDILKKFQKNSEIFFGNLCKNFGKLAEIEKKNSDKFDNVQAKISENQNLGKIFENYCKLFLNNFNGTVSKFRRTKFEKKTEEKVKGERILGKNLELLYSG